jgi:predicted dehydrogenase
VADWHTRDGLAHIPERYAIVACCDTDPVKAKEFAERYGIANIVAHYEELLRRPDVDVVAICTPPSLHYEMVLAALKAGKHVVCEKPLTSSLELADKMIAAAKTAKGRIMPVFQYRFGDGIAKVRHVIQSGLAGKHFVASIDTAKRRGRDYYSVAWRGKFATELGGVLVTQAIHIHDLVFWLLGPATAVAAFTTTRVNPIEVEDCAVANLKMADGSLVSLSATLGSARQVTRLRFCFEKVTFEKVGFDDDSSRPGEDPWTVIAKTPEIGRAIEAKMNEVQPQKAWFARQYELFHEAIHTGGPLPVELAEARAALELITACYHSNETGRAVELPIGSSHPKYRGWVPSEFVNEPLAASPASAAANQRR